MSELVTDRIDHPEQAFTEGIIPLLPDSVVAIIGLGLIGGSLAMALYGRCRKLLGIDHDPEIVEQARNLQIVDQAATDLASLLPQADVVILAVPVRAILEILANLSRLHPGRAIVMDVGSTKCAVCKVMADLPPRFDPLGGHPLCGKEIGSLANADANLFVDAIFALVHLQRTTSHARSMALELMELLGSHPCWVDAELHDRWVAATSHLPHIIATALVLSTPFDCAPLAGPGFRSTSRLAAGSPVMKTDIFATNQLAVLEALSRYRQQLDILTDLLSSGDMDGLERLLALGAERRQTIMESNDEHS